MTNRDEKPQRMVTYRAGGRDFQGPVETLSACYEAFTYACENAVEFGRPCRVFMIGEGCLPIPVDCPSCLEPDCAGH